jgi:hypothetical protein
MSKIRHNLSLGRGQPRKGDTGMENQGHSGSRKV